MELEECRRRLDEIDEQIVGLYEQRMDICAQVALDKLRTGKRVFDPEREKKKIERVKELAGNDFYRFGVEELFMQLMGASRKLQYRIMEEQGVKGRLPFICVEDLGAGDAAVVYQGTKGSYSEQAMKAYFGDKVKSFHVDTFRDAMLTIAEGNADFGVLPIENSSAGIVSENYDHLVNFENYIVAEQIISIDHCLLGVKGAGLEDIKKVYSHEQALRQCAEFLSSHRDMETVSFPNTATAAKKVKDDGDISQAAIAGRAAAQQYGLEILRDGINSSSRNSTRFIIVTNQKIFLSKADKISICMEIAHESGSLYRILSNFIYNDINMYRIESRPIPDRPWEYRFFIDFEGNLSQPGVKNALRGVREEARSMKILGNY